MKKFRFKFSPLIWTLLFVVLLLSFAGLGFNIFNLVIYLPKGVGKTVIYSIMIVLILLLITIDLSIIFGGEFTIGDKFLTAKFGFIKSKIKLSDIYAVVLYKKDDKLVVYAKDDKYLVIVIAKELYDEFLISLRKKNKSITYDVKEKDIDPV